MGEVSLVARLYDEVQFALTHLINADKNPTTQQLMQIAFKKDYNSDSRKQYETIREIINRGRDNGIMEFQKYADSQDFIKDLSEIDYYTPQSKISEDEAEYDALLYEGFFQENTPALKEYKDEMKPVSLLWEQNLRNYSDQGNNIVISSYGPKARWSRPSYWKWAIREQEIYLRSARIIIRQLQRGMGTKIALPDSTRIAEALEMTTEMKQLLEYKSKIPS